MSSVTETRNFPRRRRKSRRRIRKGCCGNINTRVGHHSSTQGGSLDYSLAETLRLGLTTRIVARRQKYYSWRSGNDVYTPNFWPRPLDTNAHRVHPAAVPWRIRGSIHMSSWSSYPQSQLAPEREIARPNPGGEIQNMLVCFEMSAQVKEPQAIEINSELSCTASISLFLLSALLNPFPNGAFQVSNRREAVNARLLSLYFYYYYCE